ncbi:hypothetical protein [Pseudogemmobacter sonorensis]
MEEEERAAREQRALEGDYHDRPGPGAAVLIVLAALAVVLLAIFVWL